MNRQLGSQHFIWIMLWYHFIAYCFILYSDLDNEQFLNFILAVDNLISPGPCEIRIGIYPTCRRMPVCHSIASAWCHQTP